MHYYGVRKVNNEYFPLVGKEVFDKVPFSTFNEALKHARSCAWEKFGQHSRIECYQGDNAAEYEGPNHFQIYDDYRKRIG